MVDKKSQFGDNSSVLKSSHADILAGAELLENALIKIRYEGKASLARNVKNVHKVLSDLKSEIRPHIQVENTFFAFLEKHVPKTQSLMQLLLAEHKEIQALVKALELLLKKVSVCRSEARCMPAIEKLKEKGLYLVYLLRHHIHVEDEHIYSIARRELRIPEKNAIAQAMRLSQGWDHLSGRPSAGRTGR